MKDSFEGTKSEGSENTSLRIILMRTSIKVEDNGEKKMLRIVECYISCYIFSKKI